MRYVNEFARSSSGAKSVTAYRSGSTSVAIYSERGVTEADTTNSAINCDVFKLPIRLHRLVLTLSCVAILWSRLMMSKIEHSMTAAEICGT